MPESTGAQPWRLERYRDGDEHAVLGLFRTVFGKARSPEHWTWQFKSNPYGGPFVSMARRNGDDAVVGSYSVMPLMLNVMGKAVPACQSVDTAVHPDHRGQRIFERTASDCYEWCASQGLQAVVGFPNANSYPGFVRSLGWKRIAFPTKHLLRLGVKGALQRVLGVPIVPGLVDGVYRAGRRIELSTRRSLLPQPAGARAEFRITDTVPEAYDGLWNACRSYEVLSIWKDTAYLRWRYDLNPDHRFVYLHLTRGGEIPALAVAVDVDGTLALCELMIAGRDIPMGRRLVAEICLYALSRGHRAVSFLSHDAGIGRDVLAGFSHDTAYADVFGGRSFDRESALAELLPHALNWTVTFGDGDFV